MSAERPWLDAYPADVPASLEPYPSESVFSMLESAARRFPDRPALAWFGRHMSYAELLAEVERCSGMLAGLGVARGDRVAMIMPNSPAFTITFYACMRIGAVAVGNNPVYSAREMAHQLDDAEPTVVLVADLMYADFAGVFAELGIAKVIVTRLNDYMPGLKKLLAPMLKFKKQQRAAGKPWPPVPKDAPVLRWHRAMASAGAVPPVATVDPRNDAAVLIYTGGTTGVAKGAMLSHANLDANARQAWAWITTIEEGKDVVLAALPFFHSYGLLAMVLTSLIAAKLVPVPNPRDIHLILEICSKERPTFFPGVPRLYVAINEYPDLGKFDLNSVKACVSGAAPLPQAVAAEFARVSDGAVLVEGYGLTECSPVTHVNPMDGRGRPGSIGLPIPDTDVRLISLEDPDKEMPQGEPGELCIKGPQVMLGYWRRPEETALAIRNGWFHTGDVAVMEPDGFFRIVDRLKDMILVSGFNVYPNEVEDVLYHHPSISKCAVVGLPDARTGERVKAYVVLREGETLTADALIAWCKDPAQGLAGYRVPKDIEFRETLPETLVGKVLRRVLQDEERQKAAAPVFVNPIHWDLGDGLVVRTYVPDDDRALFDLIDANRAHLRPWMLWEHTTKDVSDTRTWIESCLASPTDMEGNGLWVDGDLAGGAGLSIDTVENSGEVGFWLAQGFEGRGLVTRACARFFDLAFDELGLHRMELCAAIENTRSRAVAGRLGMHEEGIARDGCRVADGYLDLVTYGLLEDEWRARRTA